MTKTIEQLKARITELERSEHWQARRNSDVMEQLLSAQAEIKRLRDALQEYIDEHEECQDADDWMAMMCSMEAHHTADEALSQPSDTSALDSFVAEKVKELDEANEHHRQLARVSRDNELKATKQRDLAVEALEFYVPMIPTGESPAEVALAAIKESEKL